MLSAAIRKLDNFVLGHDQYSFMLKMQQYINKVSIQSGKVKYKCNSIKYYINYSVFE